MVCGNGYLYNYGMLCVGEVVCLVIECDGDFDNCGQFDLCGSLYLQVDVSLENFGCLLVQGVCIILDGDVEIDNYGDMQLCDILVVLQGDSDFDNGECQCFVRLVVDGGGFVLGGVVGFENYGIFYVSGVLNQGSLIYVIIVCVGNDCDIIDVFNNYGSIVFDVDVWVFILFVDIYVSMGINWVGGQIISYVCNYVVLYVEGVLVMLFNQGIFIVIGDYVVVMFGVCGVILINDGMINFGIVGVVNGQYLVVMCLDGLVMFNNCCGGVINIYVDYLYVFQSVGGGSGWLINNGQVNVYGSGSGINVDVVIVVVNWFGVDLGWQVLCGISGYIVGMNVDGSVGCMVLYQGGYLVDVVVDIGFICGIVVLQVYLLGVFIGVDSGEDNICSVMVVWCVQVECDVSGNVDVVMICNDYCVLVDVLVQGVVVVLEVGYGNLVLFYSLEVVDIVEFNCVLYQLFGGQVMVVSQCLVVNGEVFWLSLVCSVLIDGYYLLVFGLGVDICYGVQGVGSGLQLVVLMQGGCYLQMMFGLFSMDVVYDGGQMCSQLCFVGVGIGQLLGVFCVQYIFGNEWYWMDG